LSSTSYPKVWLDPLVGLSSTIEHVTLGELRPDPHNPRLPLDVKDQLSGDDLLVKIADSFDPLILADSIARHGYFGSEPLIVLRETDAWLVLEGNRRLAALLGLARADLRERFADRAKWEQLDPETPITLETPVPVIIADAREDADAVIGFRHIGQVLEWKPLQRAQFIAYLVDERGQSFAEVSDTVGEEEDTVRMRYRNQSILRRAAELGRQDILDLGQRSFGTYTAALNRTGLREFVGTAAIGEVVERSAQIADEQLPSLVELFGWLFGIDGDSKVIGESRELTRLSTVVQHGRALAELRRSRDLDAAYAMTEAPRSGRDYLRQLAVAAGHLRAVVEAADAVVHEARTRTLIEEMRELLDELEIALNEADAAEEEAH
jgi:hypothetical protein